MNEDELNIKYIREKTGLVKNDELIPIILEMINECYRKDLEQSRFDKSMLEKENQELKKQQKEFIEYLKEPIRIITEGNPINLSEYTSAKLDTLKEVLSKYKEITGTDIMPVAWEVKNVKN